MRRWLAPATLLVILTLFIPATTLAQSGGRYYPETGHTLEAQFLDFFDRNGGVDIFGYPITEGFSDPETGRFIQYTENARLEWRSDESGGAPQPAVAPLGEIIGGWHLPDQEQQLEGRGCRSFEGTPHSTCYAFLEFYEANGGLELFGAPTSGFIIESDRIVQYFQYFRLDWYPDAAANHQVRVGPLGREHFNRMGYDPELLQPVTQPGPASYRVTELHPSASVEHPTVAPDSPQQIFLVVRDQNQQPVSGAAVLLIAHLPQHDRYFLMPRTDSQGVSRMTLVLDGEPAGTQVNLEIWALHRDLEAAARDSFVIR